MDIAKNNLVTRDARVTRGGSFRRAGVFAVAAALVSLWSSAAFAEQFVVLDSTWDHTPDLPDSHYRVLPLAGTPTNWRDPIDYASGTAHIHLEVFTKPTDTPTKFQVCFEAKPTYACTDQSPTYTEVGVLDWSTPFSNFWSPPNTMVDWSLGTVKIAVILKDTKNGKPSEDNVGAEVAKLYTPTKVRMVVTIVAPGSEHIPPTDPGAGAGGAGGAGGNGGGGGATGEAGGPSGPAASSSTGTGTGGQDAGTGGAPAIPEPTSADSDSGCSTAPGLDGGLGGTRPAAWFLLAGAAALLVRARRKS